MADDSVEIEVNVVQGANEANKVSDSLASIADVAGDVADKVNASLADIGKDGAPGLAKVVDAIDEVAAARDKIEDLSVGAGDSSAAIAAANDLVQAYSRVAEAASSARDALSDRSSVGNDATLRAIQAEQAALERLLAVQEELRSSQAELGAAPVSVNDRRAAGRDDAIASDAALRAAPSVEENRGFAVADRRGPAPIVQQSPDVAAAQAALEAVINAQAAEAAAAQALAAQEAEAANLIAAENARREARAAEADRVLQATERNAAAAPRPAGAAAAADDGTGVPANIRKYFDAGFNKNQDIRDASPILAGISDETFNGYRAALGQVTTEMVAQAAEAERLTALNAALENGDLKLAAAINAQIAAYAKLDAVAEDGNLNSAAGANARVRAAQADVKVADASDGGDSGGGARGFLRGLGGSGGSSGNGQSAEELGSQARQVAGFVVLYQALRTVEDGFREAITQSIEFDRSITDLQNRLSLTRDQATNLANSLAKVGAPAGLAPSQSAELGAQFAGVFAGQAPPTQLATEGTQLGAELAVLGGSAKDASEDLSDLTAATIAFNLSAGAAPRVLDAATSAAKNFGLANAQEVLPGLAQIGDLAQQAGFSVEQTANTLADLQARTGESSAATAGELQRFFGREGNAAFQEVFANLGVNTLQPFNDELSQLSDKYDTLTQKQKDFITAQFGGGRAGVAALGLIEDYGKVQDATNKSVADGGIAQQQYFSRLNDVAGLLTTLRGELELIAKDVGTSGIGAGAGLLLEALKPVLDTTQALLAAFDSIPAPIRDAAFAAAELAGAVKIIGAINLGERVGNLATNLRGRAASIGASDAAGIVASGGGALGTTAVGTTAVSTATGAAAASIVAGGEEIAAAETDTAAATLTGGTSVADALKLGAAGIGQGVTAVREALADLAATIAFGGTEDAEASTAGLTRFGSGIGPLGLAGIAVAGGVVVDQTLNATDKVLSAQAAGVGSGNADSLQGAANTAENQAVTDRRDSSGLFGTIVNAITGNQDGRDAAVSDASAKLDIALSKESTAAADKEAPSSLGASLVDLSDGTDGTNGLTQSLTNLTNAGFTASEQIDAVTERLGEAAEAAKGFIPSNEFPTVGQTVATNVAGTLGDDDRPGAGSTPRESTALSGVNDDKVGQAASSAVQDFLSQNDPTGAKLTPDELKSEQQQVEAAVIAEVEAEGIKGQKLKAILTDLNTAVGNSIAGQLSQLASSNNLSAADVTGIVNTLQSTASQAGSDAGASAQLAGGDSTTAAANTALAKTEAVYNSLKGLPLPAATLDQARQDVVDAKAAAATAANTALQSQLALAQAAISPLDKTGQLQQTVAGLQEQLLNTGQGAEATSAEKAALDQAEQELAAQVTANINAAYAVGVASDDAVGQANVALEQALNTQSRDLAQGATGAQASQDTTAVQNAQLAALQAGIAQTVAQQTAGARAGDPLAQATTALSTAQETLSGITKDTTAYYTQLATVEADQYALAQAIATDASNQFLLSSDTTNPVDTARAALVAALTQQAQDKQRGTGNAAADQVAVENAQQAAQQAVLDQQLQLQETSFNLHQETGQQYLDFLDNQKSSLESQLAATKKGSEGYQQLINDLNEVNGDILNLSEQYSGQFNLGNIKVPTVYDARVQEATTAQNPASSLGSSSNVQVINFQINGADTNAVKQIINQAIGQQPLSTRGVTTRKVTVS